MNKQGIQNGIRSTLVECFEDLGKVLPHTRMKTEMSIVAMWFGAQSPMEVAVYVKTHVLKGKRKKKIEERKEDFFHKYRYDIFKGLPKERIDEYADLLTGNTLSKENKMMMWNYLDTLVTLAELDEKA